MRRRWLRALVIQFSSTTKLPRISFSSPTNVSSEDRLMMVSQHGLTLADVVLNGDCFIGW